MSIQQELIDRSESKCELCGGKNNLNGYTVAPKAGHSAAEQALLCETCTSQIDDPEKVDLNHWRCLNDSMWSTEPAVQVLAWRMLNRISAEGWPQDLLDMMYLEEEVLEWAKATGEGGSEENNIKHIDSNGVQLQSGDTVTLIKDLNVKGSSITAKRGTAVRRISLDPDNSEYIEGKVDGQHIVILTKYVKK